MNQVADILDLAMQAEQQNIDAVLATVVRTEGSAYRHAGAMMLICADGRSVGMISGGCLEPHIVKRAFWLTRNGANVQVYQTGDDIAYNDDSSIADTNTNKKSLAVADDRLDSDLLDNELDDDLDGELNFGLGCNGRVHVLFEPLVTAAPFLALIRKVRSTQQPATIATLIKSNSHHLQGAQLPIGMRVDIAAYRDNKQVATIDGKQILSTDIDATINNMVTEAVKSLAAHTFNKRNTEYVVIESNKDKQVLDGSQLKTEWLIQQICPQIRLLICGAGNDVMPLVVMAKLQDWHVTVIDSRSQYATRMRFPQADIVQYLALDDTETLIKFSHNAAVALMSHSLTQDRTRLAVLLARPNFRYLGQLGPRYRTERLIQEISATMVNPALLDEGIAKLHYPIGYKLGGDGPEALALSIMAQMSAVIHNQTPAIISTGSKANSPISTPALIENDCINDYAHE